MALSHLPLVHPCKGGLNCDVDQQLILFPFLEPVAGATEELAAEIRPWDAVETKHAVCVWTCTIRSLSMSLSVFECVFACLSALQTHLQSQSVGLYYTECVLLSVSVCSVPPTSIVSATLPLWSVFSNAPTKPPVISAQLCIISETDAHCGFVGISELFMHM